MTQRKKQLLPSEAGGFIISRVDCSGHAVVMAQAWLLASTALVVRVMQFWCCVTGVLESRLIATGSDATSP
jgi:hypothetical protein